MCHLNYESATFLATVVGTVVAVASLVGSLVALAIAKSSLSLAKQVAEQERRDWKQRKWFDLYFQASEFYDHLDRFQTVYEHKVIRDAEDTKDWNELMFFIRRAHNMAAVFPKTPAIDELFAATAVFSDQREAVSKERLAKIANAVHGLREKALVDTTVLD
jgi:hypothetical protein